MPPVFKRDRGRLLRPPIQQKAILHIEYQEYFEPQYDLGIAEARAKTKHQEMEESRRKKMGEASALVGKHDHTPPTQEQKGSGSILSRLTGILDDLDKAIQVKDKDLNQEKGKEAENAVKLGKLKAAEAMVRQARALLEDYGVALDRDADVIPLPLDPTAWVKAGAVAVHRDTGEHWRVDSVEDLVAEGTTVKAHHEEHQFMKVDMVIDDFIEKFDQGPIDDDFPDAVDDDPKFDPDEDFSNPDAG